MLRRALLCENDLTLAGLLERVLRRAEYEVHLVENGQDALAHVHQLRYDLVVTEVALPRIDGLMVVLAMRAHAISSPVVLLTAFGDVLDVRRRAPGIAVLLKPFGLHDAARAIREAGSFDQSAS